MEHFLIDFIQRLLSRKSLLRRSLAVEDRLAQLQIPVAEFMPDKPVNGSGGIIEAVVVKAYSHFFYRFIEFRFNPFSNDFVTRQNIIDSVSFLFCFLPLLAFVAGVVC